MARQIISVITLMAWHKISVLWHDRCCLSNGRCCLSNGRCFLACHNITLCFSWHGRKYLDKSKIGTYAPYALAHVAIHRDFPRGVSVSAFFSSKIKCICMTVWKVRVCAQTKRVCVIWWCVSVILYHHHHIMMMMSDVMMCVSYHRVCVWYDDVCLIS